MQIGEVTVASTEIVDGHIHAQGADLAQLVQHPRVGTQPGTLGDFHFQAMGFDAVAATGRLEHISDVLVLEILGREVDRQALHFTVAPGLQLAEHRIDHPVGYAVDQRIALHHRNELRR